MTKWPLTIFVHRASECLTDHLSHGDGLICQTLLGGLVDRGHRVFAYTNHDGVARKPVGLVVRACRHRVPANSLANWEHAWRADQWLGEVGRRERVDLIWRMHPYGTGCPTVPRTDGRPLVIGPLFYDWPTDDPALATSGRPRLGVGIGPATTPFARRGWERTLQAASLVICATDPQAVLLRSRTPAHVATVPVIVDPPAGLPTRESLPADARSIRLAFVANIAANKRPDIFCRIVADLRARGLNAVGTVIGDGPERPLLQAWCAANGLAEFVDFAGRIDNAEVYCRTATSDLLVSTSRGEPYGRGIAEAMSVGTPAACHRSGGPADFVNDGVDGLLVDALDPGAYAGRIAGAVASGQLREMGRAAEAKATAWRPGPVIDCLEKLLLKVVRKTGRNNDR